MESSRYQKSFTYNNQTINVETNHLANQTERSFVVKWNDSVILVTLGVSDEQKESNFLPLIVDFKENLYSAGKIPGGFFRREGRPSEYAILSSRIIDRSIRNFFPQTFRNEIQVIINPLAVDYSIDIRVIAILATSLLLNTSSLPFNAHLAAINVGLIGKKIIFNPNPEQLNQSSLNMFIVGTETKISMIEITASQVEETKLIKIIQIAHQEIQKLIQIQKEICTTVQRKTNSFKMFEADPAVLKLIQAESDTKIDAILTSTTLNHQKQKQLAKLQKEISQTLQPVYEKQFAAQFSQTWWTNQLEYHIDQLIKNKLRQLTIQTQQRIDQRSFDQLRTIDCEIDYLPIVHGSAIFNRGQTQTLSTVTLGPLSEQQIIDNLTQEESKQFLHHYNSPPFAFGGVGPMRGVSRREIGHGFLGEKALKQIIPSPIDFPYTIRVVSEVMQSNGSTSQAAICSSVLALLTAGVPLKTSIAGIAMGLIKTTDDEYHILTDIQALEDFYGDMDFKIAGSQTGVCAAQLDLKIDGLPIPIIEKILIQAKTARLKILAKMGELIKTPRTELSKHALKFYKLKVKQDEISSLIGPGGKQIKKIIKDTDNANITIKDDGEVLIYHKNQKMIDKARQIIDDLFAKVMLNETYSGVVTKIAEFGAFVKLDNRYEQGLIHVSKISNQFVKKIEDFINVDDRVMVKVIKINEQKRQINFELIKNLTV